MWPALLSRYGTCGVLRAHTRSHTNIRTQRAEPRPLRSTAAPGRGSAREGREHSSPWGGAGVPGDDPDRSCTGS